MTRCTWSSDVSPTRRVTPLRSILSLAAGTVSADPALVVDELPQAARTTSPAARRATRRMAPGRVGGGRGGGVRVGVGGVGGGVWGPRGLGGGGGRGPPGPPPGRGGGGGRKGRPRL